MRALPLIALALPLAVLGSLGAPLVGAPTTLEATSLEAAVAPASPPCPLSTPTARVAADYVQLRWAECPGATYTLLRGDDPATLAPLVELNHASHIDVGVEAGGVYYYAVALGDAVSPLVVVAMPATV